MGYIKEDINRKLKSTFFLLVIIYISFISLGLPSSMLGAAWPVIRESLKLPIYIAGIISVITTISSLVSISLCPIVVKKIGTGKTVFIGILSSFIGLFIFSFAYSVVFLYLSAVFIGLGAGFIDTSLNNFVAVNFQARHMNWLHSMWGIGTTLGAYILSLFLVYQEGWRIGYLTVAIFQLILTLLFIRTFPLWKLYEIKDDPENSLSNSKAKIQRDIVIKAIIAVIVFFIYCAIEFSAGLWTSTYLVDVKKIIPSVAALGTSLFFLGITLGRIISGFLSIKLSSKSILRLSSFLLILGVIVLFINLPSLFYLLSFILIGLGCAPIFPTLMHETPNIFGKDLSQTIISMQMASAYLGGAIVPSTFGFIISTLGTHIFPTFLFILSVIMILLIESPKYRSD